MNREEELLKSINDANRAIEDAKNRFKEREEAMDSVLEFQDRGDLERFIAMWTMEKVNSIKELMTWHFPDINISEDDKKLISKIFKLKAIFPEELHKCIGCPCYDMPDSLSDE